MSNTKRNPARLWLLFLLIGLAASGWVIYWYLCIRYMPGTEETAVATRGQFGDMFGGINALFSAFAFAGLIYTVLLQREELALQRQELQETRRELARSAEAQEKSQQAFVEQLAAMRHAALASAVDTLVRVQTRIIERDSQDAIARTSPHYRDALGKLGRYLALLEAAVERLRDDEPPPKS